VAQTTGTLDFQIYFNQNVGLPGNGNLDIQLLDSTGDLIASSTSSDDNERIRIPVVQGQIYYLKVFGATGTEINTYDMTVINTPAPVPFNLELHDTQTTPPSVVNSDTGRSQFDNVTADNTPTILLRLADGGLLNDLPGNDTPDTPPDHVIPIPFNSSTLAAATTAGFRVAIFDEANNQAPIASGFAQPVGGQPGVYSFTFTTPLAEGSHFLSARVQMIDPGVPVRSGFGDFSTSLEIVVDTIAPPTVQTPVIRTNLDLAAASDSGVAGAPETFVDRVTKDTTPTFFGSIEANSIVRIYATNSSGTPVLIGQTVATPYDGANQFGQAPGIGHWEVTSNINLNSPVAGFLEDGLRIITATFEDVAGNVSAPVALNIFIDTQGPQVTAVQITSDLEYSLFQPKPSQGPTPRTDSLTISFQDPPGRSLAAFPGLQAILSSPGSFAAEPGHYVLKGDANGIIPIQSVTITLDPIFNNISASATALLTFFNPLPDDRYTLTVSDSIFDPAGNQLDGESNAAQPVGNPNFPSGDGSPGGDFIARFTIDSRSEIGVVGQGGLAIDINGNMYFDPANVDYVNRDLVFEFGISTDNLFAGKFTAANSGFQDGFDRLGAYGLINSQYRWLLDFDNDGRPDYSVVSGLQINAVPIAGDFNTLHPGDEIGLFDGTKWYLDTNANNNIDAGDTILTGTMTGLPITGDFDGDGKVDLAVHSASLNKFTFDLTSAADGTPGV
ncbi:MAG: VCBS repeat-containing protein, partial [Planctomycetaceae bacterium]|nr:VCBS repeat-containing protein [Planctomycetaceae bacterium]